MESKFLIGSSAVEPVEGKDDFNGSRFPQYSVFTQKPSKTVNRLFRSQTAFMPVIKESPEACSSKPEISLNRLFNASLAA